MKKIFLFVILYIFVIPISVRADHMYNVDMDIYIDEFGNAQITEVWDVRADSGTEWYKTMYDLGNSKLSGFVVYMDGEKLTQKNWNVDESLSEKAGYYGINYAYDGLELCFGKSDMKRHTFTLKYNLSNYVFNTSDSQVLYWTLLPNVSVDNFTVDVTSYYDFSDTLDVWGYGYKGYVYVKDGKIIMSNEGGLDNEYVVLLTKFPLNTFNTLNTYDDYNSFDDVYNVAEEGTFEYEYDSGGSSFFFFNIFNTLIGFLVFLVPIFSIVKVANDSKYGYVNNKKIDMNNLPMFRDIPCNKDIYYANALINLNNFGYKKSNILGAIILKWVRSDKIVFKNEKVGIFNKDTSVIDLTKDVTFDNEVETKLFDMMRTASKDGLLETKELEKWCRKNYSKFLNLIQKMEDDTINFLKSKGYIYTRNNKEECKYRNVMNDQLYNDSVELYGLKKYLEEFSRIDTKEVMEVKLWDEYLMFAYLFGIADKVAKQLKDMYPEILEQNTDGTMMFDYDTLIFINHMSLSSVSAASSAKSAAESYSSGGGGFSSGGGGGGSFGGGGSMGGR